MGLRSLWALPVEVPFFLFYILIAAVIALELLRGNSSFTPAFYTLFLVQAFIDCTNYVLTAMVGYDAFPRSFLETVGSNFILSYGLFCTSFQLLLHVAIAANRFTAITYPASHKRLWNQRNLAYVLTALTLTSLASVIFKVIDKIDVIEKPYGFSINNSTEWMRDANKIILLVLTCGCTFVCLVLDTRAILVLKRLSATNTKMHREDVKLFLYSLFQFVVQLALTVHYVAVVCDPATPLSRSYSYIVDVMSLSSGVFLFCMSNNVRDRCRDALHISRRSTMVHPRKTSTISVVSAGR
ncbi:hypothetical protein AAVH_06458 [Aphelenchoides avenae]|nr:hypothetical protein AAVH_06458 [Aphelenchus avenae]